MDLQVKNIYESKYSIYIVIGILSAFSFGMIYGVHILNPTYTDWLLSSGDLSQHYLGWKAYRLGEWTFPIGLTNMLAYPDKTSIIFTDSIPLFAVFFKVLSPILPENFQYFGLWGLISFVLQGVLAGRIIQHFTTNRFVIICGSIFIVFSPVMLWRMFVHTSLAGQWVLLLGLEPLFVYEKKYKSNKSIYGYVLAIGILAASIHMYFVLMCGIIVAGICLEDVLYCKRIKRSLCLLITYVWAAGLTVALLGGFSSKGAEFATEGLGYYSLNLNALFNPQGWSCILQNLTLYTGGQYEGFAYIGAGGLLLLSLSFLFIVCKLPIKETIKRNWKFMLSIAAVVLAVCFIALSPTASINAIKLYELKLPPVLTRMWEVFRASGRIVMLVTYVVVITTIFVLCKIHDKRTLSIIMGCCLLLQVYDIHLILKNKNDSFNQIIHYEFPLEENDIWDAVGDNDNIKHVVVTYWAGEDYYTLAEWALNHKMTLNSFAMAHADADAILENASALLSSPTSDEVFIFDYQDQESDFDLESNLNYYIAGKYMLGYAGEISGFDPVSADELKTRHYTFGDEHLQDGEDTDLGRCLYPGGLSYGPYWVVSAGEYEIEIIGENLADNVELSIYSSGGQVFHDFKITDIQDDGINVVLDLDVDVQDLEIAVLNNSDVNLTLSEIQMQPRE